MIAVDRPCNKVIGLLFGGSRKFLSPWPIFKYAANILNEYRYQGKKLDAASSYQHGLICVAEGYRGQGAGELSSEYQREVLAPRYPVIATSANVLNLRSYVLHTRNRFEDISFFGFNGNKYHMMTSPTS